MKIKFHGQIKGGLPVLDDSQAFNDFLATMEDKRITLTIGKERKYKERSNQQNKYYWGVVIKELSNELGYTPDEMHEALKCHFLADIKEFKREVNGIMETRTLMVTKSTTALDTQQFEDYMAKVRQWASIQLAIYIPLPNETSFDYEY